MSQFKEVTPTEIKKVLIAVKTAHAYLSENSDVTRAHARGCLNLLLNVNYLAANDPKFRVALIQNAKVRGAL